MQRSLISLVLLGALSSCAAGTPSGAACPTTQTLTYDNFGRQFMQSYCLACHNRGGQAPDLSTLANVRAQRALIDQTAAAGPDGVNTSMPQGGSISEAERRRLGEWLACGAP